MTINLIIKYIIFVLLLCSCGTARQSPSKIVGKFDWAYWQENAGWTNYEAYDYQPPIEKIQKLKELIGQNEYKFLIFASTSCEECIKHTPRIIKLLRLADYEIANVIIYGMDEYTSEPTGDYKKYRVVGVPTLVIVQGGMQICKIEYPDFNWLGRIINCLSK